MEKAERRIKGREDEEVDVNSYCITLEKRKERILQIERGSPRLHSVKTLFWKRLWIPRKKEYRMNAVNLL